MSDDANSIREAINSFVTAYNAGDLEAVLNYYSDDLIKLRNGQSAESKLDVEERLVDLFKNYDVTAYVVIDEIVVEGNIAFTRGSFEVKLVSKAVHHESRIPRRYLEIWRKDAGKWRVIRTMDNT